MRATIVDEPSSGQVSEPGCPPEPFTGMPGALVVFSDVACPWGTVVMLRLHEARAALGLQHQVPIVHLAHPLELLNDHPLARRIIDAEIPLCASMTPQFGWSLWQGRLDEYPVTSLLAAQAVQAARRQSELAAAELDLALRRAFFVQSRCISVRNEIRAAAGSCERVDLPQLLDDLEDGEVYEAVLRQAAAAKAGAASCSGYVVLPDGSGVCNPGVRTQWRGRLPGGTPVLLADEPDVYRQLVEAAVTDTGRPAPVQACRVTEEEGTDGNHCGC
jgi:predicted DsbA family dithiol-disulfide isomerase